MTIESGTGAASGAVAGATDGGAQTAKESTGSKEGLAAGEGVSSGDPGEVAGGTAGEGGQTPYTPKLKYKVLDQEKDFPDWAKPFVKDEQVEKSVRDVLEKAEGIDHIKQRRDTLETQNKQMLEHWAPVVQNVQTLTDALKKKDYDTFFEGVGIPEIELFKYVNHRLQLRENPQQLQAYEQQRQLQQQNQQLQQQVQSTQTMATEMAVQRRSWELDMELAKPEVSSAIQAFEARVSQPGAFRAEVIRRGQAYAVAGQDVPAGQAVKEVLQLIGWQGQAPSPAQATGVAPEVKPTLPNIRGKGTSPARAVPKSVDELRKLAKEMRGL